MAQKGQVTAETYKRLLGEKELYRTTLVAIRNYDSSRGGPMPAEDALREIARMALEHFGE